MFQRKHNLLSATALLAILAQLLSACSQPAPAVQATIAPATAPVPTVAQATTASVPATAQATAARSATFLKPRTAQNPAGVYGRLELAIDTDGVYANPFDPQQADLRVRFTSPSGKAALVPAFWYQDFDPATLAPKGAPSWRARFTPAEPGRWTAQAELASPGLKSEPISFDVAADTSAHGFVRVNSQNPRYFAFDDGATYFPIGLNLGWSTGQGLAVLKDYERWLDRLSQNGGNIARVWMAAWSFGIEWKDTGLGDYTKRMKQAWLLDQVFSMAEKRGVYILLCLVNHGQFSTSVNPEWNDNPYNQANGGPLARPEEFAMNPQAKDLFKRRVRYIAGRWAYSPGLFAWEWWNEVNWTPIADPQLRPWIAEMTAYLEQYDPYRHLVSSSYANGGATHLWKMPELSFAQQHDYSGRDPAKDLASSFRSIAENAPQKPVLLAEYGYSAQGAGDQIDSDAMQLHNGLWAAPFSGFASTAMYWWWDNFVDPRDQWSEFKGISEFLKGEDLAALAPSKVSVDPPFGSTALILQSNERALVWVRSGAYDTGEAVFAYEKAIAAGKTKDWKYVLPVLKDVKLTVTGLADGAYTARWFDPHTAASLTEQPIQVQDGAATLAAPAFDRDLAVKIVKR